MRLRIALGVLWAKVAPRSGRAPQLEVRTDRVVAGVRGTQFIVEAGEAHAVVLEGAVEVAARMAGRSATGRATRWRPGPPSWVVGTGGRHDFNESIAWVRSFDGEAAKVPTGRASGAKEPGRSGGTSAEDCTATNAGNVVSSAADGARRPAPRSQKRRPRRLQEQAA